MSYYKRPSIYIHFDNQDQDVVVPWISMFYDQRWDVMDSGQGVHIETRKLLTRCDFVVLVVSNNIYTQESQIKSEINDILNATNFVRKKLVLVLLSKAKIPDGFSDNGSVIYQYKDDLSTLYFFERLSIQILPEYLVDDLVERFHKSGPIRLISDKLNSLQNDVERLRIYADHSEEQIHKSEKSLVELQEKVEDIYKNLITAERLQSDNLVYRIYDLEGSLERVRQEISQVSQNLEKPVLHAQSPVKKEPKTPPDQDEVLREIRNLLKRRQIKADSLIAETEKFESIANEYSKKTAKLQKQMAQMEDYYESLNDKIAASERKIKELRREIVTGEVSLKQVQFAVSVAFPKRFSKGGQSSNVYVHLYLPRLRKIVEKAIQLELDKKGVDEKNLSPTQKLALNQLVQISLTSHDVDFGDAKKVRLENDTRVAFNAKPKESCTNGIKWVMLDITNAETGETLVSENFEIRVYDVLIGFIPRPLANQVSSAVLAIGSSVMLFLTFVGKVDDAFGFTSGATAWAISAFVLARLINLYQSQGKTHNVT